MASPLAVLMRMRSPSNMTSTGDPYLDKRRQQIIGGDDELAPSELDQHLAQTQLSSQGAGGFSRDMIRDSGINALKKKLGLMQLQSEADTADEHVRGQYGVKQAEIGAREAASRQAANQEAIAARQEASQAAMMERLQQSLTQRDTAREDQQQFKVENPTGASRTTVPAQLYDAVNKARGGYESMANNPVSRFLFGNGRTSAYETALTNVLDRKGTLSEVQEVLPVLQQAPGASVDEKIANSGVPGLQSLDPYERQYLQLKLQGR